MLVRGVVAPAIGPAAAAVSYCLVLSTTVLCNLLQFVLFFTVSCCLLLSLADCSCLFLSLTVSFGLLLFVLLLAISWYFLPSLIVYYCWFFLSLAVFCCLLLSLAISGYLLPSLAFSYRLLQSLTFSSCHTTLHSLSVSPSLSLSVCTLLCGKSEGGSSIISLFAGGWPDGVVTPGGWIIYQLSSLYNLHTSGCWGVGGWVNDLNF